MRKRLPEMVGNVSRGVSSGEEGGHHSLIFQGLKDIVRRVSWKHMHEGVLEFVFFGRWKVGQG